MPVTIDTAEQAMKIVYLNVVRGQLNDETDPFFNHIKASSKHVTGKEVRKMAPYGVNGGIGAGSEVGTLPIPGGNNYIQFVCDTKNLYGTLSISDKSIKASANNAGAFVQLLNGEIEGLMKAAKFNMSRMLHTDGTGILTLFKANVAATVTLLVDSCKYLIEGLTVDIRNAAGAIVAGGDARRVLSVNRVDNSITVSGAVITTIATDFVSIQQSYNMELTGMAEIFKATGSLYGVDRVANFWMRPYMKGAIAGISDIKIQAAIDYLSEIMGSKINYLLAPSGVTRSYYAYLEATKRNVNTLELKGGFTALGYGKIPMVSSRFAKEGTLKLMDTSQFMFHHMGDWDWMQGQGNKILTQIPNTPVWTATLVKYAELMCDHPGGQAELSGITEDMQPI